MDKEGVEERVGEGQTILESGSSAALSVHLSLYSITSIGKIGDRQYLSTKVICKIVKKIHSKTRRELMQRD